MTDSSKSAPAGVRILDTTIRDGGYMVNHHYSKSDIATIAGCLDLAGIPYIEVGYGMGLFADEFAAHVRPKSLPTVRAAGHAQAALAAAANAQIGVLFVAGKMAVAVERLKRVAELGYSFVRLAVMPDEYNEQVLPYVTTAKECGLTVSVNLMQTDLLSPQAVAEMTAIAADAGLDWFSVVDSAGGMSADDVKRYVSAVLEKADVAVGLHSHNNTGQAVTNSIAAVEAGATMVDGTLNGMGRSTGNSPTELLAITLRDQLAHPVDLDALVRLSRSLRSFLEPGNEPFDFVSGGGRVHSRDVNHVREAAKARGRSASWFLLAAGAEARKRQVSPSFHYPDEVYDAVVDQVPAASTLEPSQKTVDMVKSDILERYSGGVERALEDLRIWSQQRHKVSVLHLSSAAAPLTERAIAWEGDQVGITLPMDRVQSIPEMLIPDYIVVDDGKPVQKAKRDGLSVPFQEVYTRAVRELAMALVNRHTTLWCLDEASKLQLGDVPCHTTPQRTSGAMALVSTADHSAALARLQSGDYLLATTRITRHEVDAAKSSGIFVVTPNWTAALASLIGSLIAVDQQLNGIADAPLVSPIQAPATRQAVWDARRGVLRDADQPEESALNAARQHIGAIWDNKKRF